MAANLAAHCPHLQMHEHYLDIAEQDHSRTPCLAFLMLHYIGIAFLANRAHRSEAGTLACFDKLA